MSKQSIELQIRELEAKLQEIPGEANKNKRKRLNGRITKKRIELAQFAEPAQQTVALAVDNGSSGVEDEAGDGSDAVGAIPESGDSTQGGGDLVGDPLPDPAADVGGDGIENDNGGAQPEPDPAEPELEPEEPQGEDKKAELDENRNSPSSGRQHWHPDKEVYVFMDMTNMFLCAQNEAGDVRGLWCVDKKKRRGNGPVRQDLVPRDHRVRLNAALMLRKATTSLNFLPQHTRAYLYGSWKGHDAEDAMLRHFENAGWTMHIEDRWGPEKQVDTHMTSGIVQTACSRNYPPLRPQDMIVVMTCDIDQLPAVKKAIEFDCRVEVIAWGGEGLALGWVNFANPLFHLTTWDIRDHLDDPPAPAHIRQQVKAMNEQDRETYFESTPEIFVFTAFKLRDEALLPKYFGTVVAVTAAADMGDDRKLHEYAAIHLQAPFCFGWLNDKGFLLSSPHQEALLTLGNDPTSPFLRFQIRPLGRYCMDEFIRDKPLIVQRFPVLSKSVIKGLNLPVCVNCFFRFPCICNCPGRCGKSRRTCACPCIFCGQHRHKGPCRARGRGGGRGFGGRRY